MVAGEYAGSRQLTHCRTENHSQAMLPQHHLLSSDSTLSSDDALHAVAAGCLSSRCSVHVAYSMKHRASSIERIEEGSYAAPFPGLFSCHMTTQRM